MLPAQTQELEPEMATPKKSSTPTMQGFGKVLTSIQGLQQRLEDFSVEDVARAETDAKNLIHQLSALRMKLQCLAELKAFVVSASSLIDEIPPQDFDQVAPDGLENHPHLHAIVQASKLIRFHKIMKAAKAGAESISFDAEAGVLNFAPATPHAATETPAAIVEAMNVPFPAIDPSSESTPIDTANERTPIVEDHSWVFSPEPEESDAAVTEHVFDLMSANSAVNEPTELVGKTQTTALTEKDETRDITLNVGAESGIAFDQRLLSELIETYGEFTVPATLPAMIEPVQAAQGECRDFQMLPTPVHTAKPEKELPPDIPAVSAPATDQPKIEERQTLPVTISSPKPEERQPAELLAIAAPETSVTEPLKSQQQGVPTVSRHGELDRQLKSIIKDYGEYDLYSHRSTINFKMAALGAFAVLGLLLGGFYFFKVPTAPTPAAVSPAGQPSGAAADSAKPDAHAPDLLNRDKTK